MKTDIKEYGECMGVEIKQFTARDIYPRSEHDHERKLGCYVIEALNEGGFNATAVDLLDVIRWVKKHKPELLTDEGGS